MGQGPRGRCRSPGRRVQPLLRLVLLLGLARGVSGEPGTDGECEAPGVRDAFRLGYRGADAGRGGIAEEERRGTVRAARPGDTGAWVEAALLQFAPPGVGGDVRTGRGCEPGVEARGVGACWQASH